MVRVGRRGVRARTAAVACGLAAVMVSSPLAAQQSDPAELDPSAPLDPMPDLGVDWPDLDAPDAAPQPVPGEVQPAQPAQQGQAATGLEDGAATRRYVVRLTGLDIEDDAVLVEEFDKRSVLKENDGKEANAAQIDRRARADSELLTSLLQSEGYYDGEVEVAIGREGDKILVELHAAPGPRYHFESVELPGLAAAGEESDALRQAFAVKSGDPVVAREVIDAGVALKVALGELGFANASIGEQDILLDHQQATATLVQPVTPGPVARFGSIHVSGKPPFSARHVGKIARFKTGDRFQRSDVDDLRRALVATGLVAAVETKVVPRDGGKVVDIDVKLSPAPMRTLAGEIGYGTGEGVRVEGSWQHRNFFNPEGALTVRGVAGTQEQLAAVSLRRNNFRARDQVLNAQILASNVKSDAYRAKIFSVSAGIERQSNFIWQKTWTWSLGTELLASDERDTIKATGTERRRTFFIAALPGSLHYDGTDNLLDPTRGFRLGGWVSPEISLQGGSTGYVRAQLDASAYMPLSKRVVAAGRIRLGTISGASLEAIAPTRRFYSGGGGSVRGYGYQRLGPRDVDGDPIGGRGLAEFSLEARIRFGQFGIVPFIDGGTLTTSSTPDFSKWQIGVGIGARYYSSFGPIRLDIGTPLNRQSGDGRIAVIVSLGQAF